MVVTWNLNSSDRMFI